MQTIHLTDSNGEQVEPLRAIKESLEALFEKHEIERWLHTQNPQFDGKTPLQTMAEGKAERILHLLIRLEEGIHA